MRPIDADALYEQIAKLEEQARAYALEIDPISQHEKWQVWAAIFNERTAFKFDIADAPTVDAVPVVRCKDCKHRMAELSDDRKTRCYCPLVDHYTVNDWFCADGERRGDEDY